MHTERRQDDNRRHTSLLSPGCKVKMLTSEGELIGTIYDVDGGGWIYVDWDPPTTRYPNYLRSTNVMEVV